MKKLIYFFSIALMIAVACGEEDDNQSPESKISTLDTTNTNVQTEIPLPEMTVSYSENDVIYFSEVDAASINVKISCEGNVLGCKMSCDPPRWHWDSVFQNFTHEAEFNLNFIQEKGYAIEVPDSTYKLTFMAYTENDSVFALRTLKYKLAYPEIDSFDIELYADPDQPCLLDIKNKCAYKYTEFATHNFDLVFINEQRSFYTAMGMSGLSFISPDAQAYLSGYFESVNNMLPPYEEGYLTFRTTKIGYVNPKAINNDLLVTDVVVATEDNWTQVKMELEGQNLGAGLHEVNRGTLYKCQLHDGSYVVIVLKERVYSESKVVLKVYFQK